MAEDLQAKIDEIEARRAARKDETARARLEQYAKDVIEIDRLEGEHGNDRVAILKMPSYVSGLPTLVVVSTPTQLMFERFRQMVRKAGGNTESMGKAKDMLAATCVAFPDADTYARMRESWPSIHDNVGLEAIRLGESEGKA